MRIPCQDDPNLWFSTKAEDKKRAISLCKGCENLENCLLIALDYKPEYGIWAGMEPKELEELWTET